MTDLNNKLRQKQTSTETDISKNDLQQKGFQ